MSSPSVNLPGLPARPPGRTLTGEAGRQGVTDELDPPKAALAADRRGRIAVTRIRATGK